MTVCVFVYDTMYAIYYREEDIIKICVKSTATGFGSAGWDVFGVLALWLILKDLNQSYTSLY
jgi:hypothetical protein